MPKDCRVNSLGDAHTRLNTLKGIFFMLFCQFFSASSLNLVKLSIDHLNPVTVTWLIFSLCFIFLIIKQYVFYRKRFDIKTTHLATHLSRSTLGGIYFILLFYSAHLIPTAESIVLRGTAPIWLCIISLFVLKKHIRPPIAFAVLISFVGLTLILHPHFEKTNMGYIIALGSGLCFSINALLTHKLSQKKEPYHRILLYTFLTPSIILSPYALTHLSPVLTNITLALHIILAACFIFLVYIFYVKSLHLASPIIILPLSNIGVLFAGIYDWLIWHHTPNEFSMMGMIIIITSCSYIALQPNT